MLRANEITYPEYEQAVQERVVVWPVGIVEEHGPHLPLGTDTYQVEAVVHDAADQVGAVVLPTFAYGNAHSTRPFPGTISLTRDTMQRVTREVLLELDRHGARGVCVISGHAGSGHMHALKTAAQDVTETGGPRIAVLSEWDIIYDQPRPIAGVDIPPHDGHAGAMETARILDLRPELVDRDAIPPDHVGDEHPYVLAADAAAAMPDGYGGDPSLATAKLGAALHEIAVGGLVEVLEDLADAAGLAK